MCTLCLEKNHTSSIQFLGLLLPVIVIPDRVIQNVLEERRPSQRARQRKVPLWCLLDVVNEFGCSEPALLAFYVAICSRPADLSAERLEVTLALSPFLLLDGIAEFAVGEFDPQSFHRCQICRRDVLHVGEVHEIPTLRLRSRKLNQRVTSELRFLCRRMIVKQNSCNGCKKR